MAKKVGNTYYFTGKGKSSGGGGGGTSDAVQYIPQELTSPQQMQARKNQGLYYSEETPAGVITWDGDTTGKEVIEGDYRLCKVSTDTPLMESVKTFGYVEDGEESIRYIEDGDAISINGGYVINNGIIIVITESEATIEGILLSKGVWFRTEEGRFVSKLTYDAYKTIHHIEPKYIKDMYYKEFVAAGEIAWDGVSSGLDYITVYGSRYYKISDDISIVNTLPTVEWAGHSEDVAEWIDSPSVVQSGHCYTSSSEIWILDNAVLIDAPNYSSTETQPITGVYMMSKGTNVPVTIYWDAYYITHQIPAEYIPSGSGGLQTYDIDVEWSELNQIISDGYGYISWGSSDPEAAYEEVCQALADGKMIALNIGQGSYGFPGGKLLSGNFVPLNKENNDGDFASIVFKVYWPTYIPNTDTLNLYSEYLIRLTFHEGLEEEEWMVWVKAEAVTV